MMTYREKAVAICKIAGEEMIERAEELIPNTEGVTQIDIRIWIPSMTDDPYLIPEIRVESDVYPRRLAMEKIAKVIHGDDAI